MSFAANIAVVMVAAIMIAFYIYTLLMYTTHVHSKPSIKLPRI